jgi:ribosome recycling factor
LLDPVKVSYEGQNVGIDALARVVVKDNQSLNVIVFDKSHTKIIDKAIRSANLNLNPILKDDHVINVPVPK